MKKLKEFLESNNLRIRKYQEKGKIIIIDTNSGRYVVKANKYIDKEKLFNYLDSRSFNNYLKPIYFNNDYDVYDYVEEFSTPLEQRAIDIINIISFLHNKTTFYRNVNLDKIKQTYEDISNKISSLNDYYHSLQDNIEQNEIMSPSDYLIIRNCSFIYSNLRYCRDSLDKWYKIVSNKQKERVVTLHNNLKLDNVLEGNKKYLISWDRSFKASPIYDLYNLFNNTYDVVDFSSLYKLYLSKYQLLEEEQLLFFTLISMPHKINLEDNEIKQCLTIRKDLDKLDRINKFILDNRAEQEKEKQP